MPASQPHNFERVLNNLYIRTVAGSYSEPVFRNFRLATATSVMTVCGQPKLFKWEFRREHRSQASRKALRQFQMQFLINHIRQVELHFKVSQIW